MKRVAVFEFLNEIAKDHNINPKVKIKDYKRSFKMVNGNLKIKAFSDSIIVDLNGNEFPYMLSVQPPIRNDEKLLDFDYIYRLTFKSLSELTKEAGIELKSEDCRICEGGGWYSHGTRYFYKEISCEI